MSVKFQVSSLKSLGLAVGLFAFLLGNSSALAGRYSSSDSTSPSDVIIDTEPGGRSSDSSRATPDTTTRFTCQVQNGQYTVMYQPESQPNQLFAWATPSAMGGGWSPEKRCYEISRRLESYRPDGLLDLTTGIENGYNTVCVTTEAVSSCRIVFTVPPGQDPVVTRDRVFDNLTVADSGQDTTGVTAYRNGRNNSEVDRLLNVGRSILGGGNNTGTPKSINLKPFLDRADGGTGTRLVNGIPVKKNNRVNNQRQRRLEPGSFR